jgi:hypothetical protein
LEKKSIYIAELIAKYVNNTISAEEMDILRSHISEEQLTILLEKYENDRVNQEELLLYFESRKEKAWKELSERRKNKSVRWIRYYRYAAVAATLLLFATFAYWMYSDRGQKTYYNEVIPDHRFGHLNDISPGKNQTLVELANGEIINLQDKILKINIDSTEGVEEKHLFSQHIHAVKTIMTPRASNIEVWLPDRTKVWLNASSTLTIDKDFNVENRKVSLKGEAFFQVAKNTEKRFQVITDKDTVSVFGTSFNVNHYTSDTYTTLTEGKVSIYGVGGDHLSLEPGQQAYRNRGNLTARKVDVRKYTSWKDGYFYFKQDNLDYILSRLAEWYDIEIQSQVPSEHIRISGTIDKNVTLAEAVSILEDVSGLHFTINNRTLKITNGLPMR